MLRPILRAAVAAALLPSTSVFATPIAYQGELIDAGVPANGRYDLQLTVHGDAALTSALALPITLENIVVENGRFRVEADFGDLRRAGLPITPDHAWLEIGVRDAGSKNGFDSLAQREKIVLDKAIAACWSSTGDDGSNPAINFLGTIDAQAFEVRVGNQRAARFEPNTISPNLLQGHASNLIATGVHGAVIGGGGALPNTDPDVTSENLNDVLDHYGVIGGGSNNTAGHSVNGGTLFDAAFATVGGGRLNTASGAGSVVAGGEQNDAEGANSAVGGGERNDARGGASFIGGGLDNDVSPLGFASTIAGGNSNEIDDARFATIGGGDDNFVVSSADGATIGGGLVNVVAAGASAATIAGGDGNVASATAATVAGGSFNLAFGQESMVAGGTGNCAGARGSFAAGSGAVVRAPSDLCGAGTAAGAAGDVGSFVWADRSGGTFASTGSNQFLVRASGGVAVNGTPRPGAELTLHGETDDPLKIASIEFVSGNRTSGILAAASATESEFTITSTGTPGFGTRRIFEARTNSNDVTAIGLNGALNLPGGSRALVVGTNANTGNGAHLTVGGTWTNGSSRAFKHAFEAIDVMNTLERVLALPLTRWKYRGADDEGTHLGPMAEDFHTAFGLGSDARYISTVDAAGVAFAAIQGLHAATQATFAEVSERVDSESREVETLRAENRRLHDRLDALQARIESMRDAHWTTP